MNPHEWKDAVERLQRHLEPNHQSAVNTSTSSNSWNTHCSYTTRYAAVDPHGSNVGRMEPSPPPPHVYRKDSKLEELDGEAAKMNEDEELARKKQQLREIEERIVHKKASIALKTVGQLVNKTAAADVSCKGGTLRDRVNVILQRRCPLGFLSKVQSRKDSSCLSKEGLTHQQHPLKLRVTAVMKQRSSVDCILLANREETPEVALPPPSRSLASPAKEENGVNKGFERFLSILNKGVDINMLSRIVNDDRVDLPLGQELLDIQSSDVEKKSDPVLRGESQQSNSRTNSSETKSDSLTERLSSPDAEETNNDEGRRSLSSRSRSKSPPAAKKKKKKEEEEKPKVDEKQAQLQNILKTLGLSLEVEEMSKLADRTEERLYGKKTVDRPSTDSRGEQESQQRDSHRDPSPSSSSSSSSCSSSSSRSSSRSTSRSFSRSPSPRHDGRRFSQEAQRGREKDGTNSQQIPTYQHPYNQTFPLPHAAPSAFPGYSLYPHYPNNQSVAFSAQTRPPWPPPPVPYPNFPPPVVPVRNSSFHRQRERCLDNLITFECPDLAESEGQGVSAARPCYLQAVRTVQPSKQPCLKQIVGCSRKKRNRKKTAESKRNRREKKRLLKQERELREAAQKAEASKSSKDDSRTKQSDEEKPPPTEQEIKANLRKRLEAFNQKAKRSSQLLQPTVMQPANSLTSENG